MASFAQYVKDAIIDAIMQDVPKVDHEEAVRTALIKIALREAPPSIRAVYNDLKARPYLNFACVYHWRKSWHGIPAPDTFQLTTAQQEEVEPLVNEMNAQNQALNEMRAKVKSAVYGCSTAKAFVKRYPEFAKYVPEAHKVADNVPAPANLITDLMTLGWPKDVQTLAVPAESSGATEQQL